MPALVRTFLRPLCTTQHSTQPNMVSQQNSVKMQFVRCTRFCADPANHGHGCLDGAAVDVQRRHIALGWTATVPPAPVPAHHQHVGPEKNDNGLSGDQRLSAPGPLGSGDWRCSACGEVCVWLFVCGLLSWSLSLLCVRRFRVPVRCGVGVRTLSSGGVLPPTPPRLPEWRGKTTPRNRKIKQK